jgi:hypothetical protein
MKYPQFYLSHPPEIHATLSCPFWLGLQSQQDGKKSFFWLYWQRALQEHFNIYPSSSPN